MKKLKLTVINHKASDIQQEFFGSEEFVLTIVQAEEHKIGAAGHRIRERNRAIVTM